MAHFEAELKEQAMASFAAMKDAALAARRLSARAELMRHMGLAAARQSSLPRDAAALAVVEEWIDAWRGARGELAAMRTGMLALSAACVDYARAPSDATDRTVRAAFAALAASMERNGRPIEDEMASRSESALAWWSRVRPAADAKPFWA